MLKMLKLKPVLLHKTGPQVSQEISACIGCNECLLACPAVAEPISPPEPVTIAMGMARRSPAPSRQRWRNSRARATSAEPASRRAPLDCTGTR